MPKVSPAYKAETRARILRAAIAVFGRRGLRGTSMEAIATEVGVTKGALYRYFRNKTDLLRAIRAGSEFSPFPAPVRPDGGDACDGLARGIARRYDNGGASALALEYDLLAAAGADGALRRALRGDLRTQLQALRAAIDRLASEGRIAPVLDADATAFAIYALSVGAGRSSFVGLDRYRTRRELRAVLRALLHDRPVGTRRRVAAA